MELNHEIIDGLALQFANGDEGAFIYLYDELESFIKREVRKAVNKAYSTYVYIPESDFESAYNQAIWEAAKGFNGDSKFIQRYYTFSKRREADVWRSYRIVKNGEAFYDKARTTSLDMPVTDDGATLGDVVLANHAAPSSEDEFVGVDFIHNAVEDFVSVNSKHQKIIKLLMQEVELDAIAQEFGEPKYNGKMRALIFRARASFEKYLKTITVEPLSIN